MTGAKVRVGSVWDTAVAAVRGRLGLLVPIAALTLFLPNVIQAGMTVYSTGATASGPASTGGSLLRLALMLGLLVLTLWGALAITAITGDPATTGADARRRASARLPALLGVTVVLGLAGTLLIVPVVAILVASGIDMTAMQANAAAGLARGTGLFLALYGLILAGVLTWLFARLLPLVPTILHERLGLRAVPRAFRSTRGLGLKLVGALLLYGIVLFVATSAARWVTFIPFRLALGGDGIGTATFIGAVVGAVISTAFSVFAYAFTAQLYERVVARERVEPIGDARAAV